MFRSKTVIARRPKLPPEGLLCNYQHRPCMQNRLSGYDYCIRHILEDKTAPYKQCSYIYPKNGKRCPNAASKMERKDGYCRNHAYRNSLLKQRAYRKVFRPPETPESIIEDLDHYNILDSYHEHGNDVSARFSPTALARLPLNAPVSHIGKIIDYTSESDSDVEPIVVDQTWKGSIDSDTESIDSEQTDPLKHAGVYTAEEVALITRDKLIRLQSLYIEQFKRLQHLIREKRRKYLQMVKQEKECGLHANYHISAEESDQYKKLKSLLHYHRRNGVERLLYIQSKERRKAVTEGINYKPVAFTKCISMYNDKKCGQRAMPFSKYCTKHILNDISQVLYHPCSSHDCDYPTIPLFGMANCTLHQTLPPLSQLRETAISKDVHNMNEQIEQITQNADDVCGLQSSDFAAISGSDIPSLYGDSSTEPPGSKEIWSDCLTTPEAKLREELDAIDLTPGELPPEQLLANS